jgi:hypothetical protein
LKAFEELDDMALVEKVIEESKKIVDNMEMFI